MDRSDTSWSGLHEAWERLRWARKRAGLTQEQAGAAAGLKRTAYLKYEAEPGSDTGNVPLKYDQARPLAKRLKVRWEWLLEGDGIPFDDGAEESRTRPAAKIGRLVDAAKPEDQEKVLAVVQAMLKAS